jgi:hypothetical protein
VAPILGAGDAAHSGLKEVFKGFNAEDAEDQPKTQKKPIQSGSGSPFASFVFLLRLLR